MPTPIYLTNEDSDVSGYKRAIVGGRSPYASSTVYTTVTATTGSGSNIQQTLTSGGTAAKWITSKLSSAVTVAAKPIVNAWVKESAAAANAQVRFKFAQYTTSEQTPFLTTDYGTEAGTTIARSVWAATESVTSTAFVAGNRLAILPYIHNVGTMGASQTLTMDYNGATQGADGDTYALFDERIEAAVLDDLIRKLKNRVHVSDNDQWLVDELNESITWAWNRLSLMNTKLEANFETTGTFSSDTTTLDLSLQVGTAQFDSALTFWVKGSNETEYTPVVFMDVNDPRFLSRSQLTTAQLFNPTYAAMVDYSSIRFAPAIPSGTTWRLDWTDKPPKLSLDSQATTTIPEPLHSCILSHAEGLVWRGQDDSRSGQAIVESMDLFATASKIMKRRQVLTKPRSRPYPPSYY